MKFSSSAILLFLVFPLISHAQADTTRTADTVVRGSITVNIKTFRNTRGSANIAIYNRSQAFMKKEIFKGMILPVGGSLITARFDSIPRGNYAIAVIHDENGDGVMNTNDMGIPTEGYAFSNDARGMFGPPEYKDARFYFSGKDRVLNLNLVYSKAR